MKISRNTLSNEKKLSQMQSTPSPTRMDSFSQQFQSKKQGYDEAHLKELFRKIKKKGEQVIKSQSIRAANEYKAYIKEYLSFILKSSYKVKDFQSKWSMDSLSIVSIIDQELDELGRIMLSEEKDTFALINKIDTIEGLLLDVYK